MKVDFQSIVNGFLMGLGAGFGFPLAAMILSKFA